NPDCVWLRRRSRHRHAGRRLRLPAETGRPRASQAAGAARRSPAGTPARESSAARRLRRALRLSAHRRRACFDPRCQPVRAERCFERVGGTQSIEGDARIVVATNRNLQQHLSQKLFREDLYFRISAVPLTIPPLRERGDDVLLLAAHFLEKFSREFNKPRLELSKDAEDRLLHYRWPGNVRELRNTLERAVILADGTAIRADGLQLPTAKPDDDAVPA